jgi:beta-glucosidase
MKIAFSYMRDMPTNRRHGSQLELAVASREFVMKKIMLLNCWVIMGLLLPALGGRSEVLLYQNPAADVDARVADLLQRMSLEEKLNYLGGVEKQSIRPLERFGVPAIRTSDGPMGVRLAKTATAFPGGICAAATWDREVVRRIGEGLARDCRATGVRVLLGPAVNIYRAPMGGRNFEYFGEDPYLAGQTAVSMIQGIQSQGVLATVKHYVCNDQETDRHQYSAEVDERTLREIYLEPFRAAVQEGKVACVMTAYNRVNGTSCDMHLVLNQQILRKEWGFDGILMNDWGVLGSPAKSLRSTLNLEMPRGRRMNAQTLGPALERGEITESEVNEGVRRTLRTIIAAGFLDHPLKLQEPREDVVNRQTALDGARGGIVLLKNQRELLPLDSSKKLRVAVIGPNTDTMIHSGGGSAYTLASQSTSIWAGLKQVAARWDLVKVDENINPEELMKSAMYDGPVTLQLFKNRNLQNEPVVRFTNSIGLQNGQPPLAVLQSNAWSARWVAQITPPTDGVYGFTTRSDDGMRVYVDEELLIDDWNQHPVRFNQKSKRLTGGRTYRLRVEYYQVEGRSVADFGWGPVEDYVEEAVRAAEQADVAVVCAGYNAFLEGESHDRAFDLPEGQVGLIRAVANANSNTVVVMVSGGGVNWEGWLEQTPALLQAWYAGQAGGVAIAEVLCGAVNPSGKLPVTFERKWSDNPSAPYYLNRLDSARQVARYGEGIFVGYRGYDRSDTEPAFCFGHGLSYTTFAYGKLELKKTQDQALEVNFQVKNTGKRTGAEVVQVYISPAKSEVERPEQELKGFTKITLQPRESRNVRLVLPRESFSYWDPKKKAFWVEGGTYTIRVGASSRDIRLNGDVALPRFGGQ